jgi:glycosyltransferase involved in cell wall biosynthesis
MTFSLVLFTYNQEKFVEEAVKAALNQQCSPIEILITDDNSSDKTFDIVKECVKNYKGPHKIILNRNDKNLGLIEHIDIAHQIASGEVIIAAAGDDISLPNRCQKIIDCFKKENPLLVFSYANVIDENGNKSSHPYKSATLYQTKNIFKVARSGKLYNGATGAWHRNLYEKYGPIEEGAYEDLVLGFRAAIEGKFSILTEPLIFYRLGFGISSAGKKYVAGEDFRKKRLQLFRHRRAVFIQRHKDALSFGYSKESSLIKIIDRRIRMADIGIKYYSENLNEIRKIFFKYPYLTLRCFLIEIVKKRRNKKKWKVR